MKKKKKINIIITDSNEQILYSGRAINIKIKEDSIIEKSIELFDDEEPCIIHQSYIVKEYANLLIELLEQQSDKTLYCKDHLEELSFLDYQDLENVVITLK